MIKRRVAESPSQDLDYSKFSYSECVVDDVRLGETEKYGRVVQKTSEEEPTQNTRFKVTVRLRFD